MQEDQNRMPSKICSGVEDVIKKALGVENVNVLHEIVTQAAGGYPYWKNEEGYKTVLGSIIEMKPNDAIEAKLYAKEGAVYAMAMEYMKRAEKALCGDELGAKLIYEDLMKSALKLLRLHNDTVDVIARYKRRGEQRVVVQHVNVEGGQNAFMTGNFHADGGGKPKNTGGSP